MSLQVVVGFGYTYVVVKRFYLSQLEKLSDHRRFDDCQSFDRARHTKKTSQSGSVVVGEDDFASGGGGRGAIAGCHCSWRRETNFGRVDVVPLLGAIAGRHFSSTLISPKLFFAIWGLCGYNFSSAWCFSKP